jgi:hypothetical protein
MPFYLNLMRMQIYLLCSLKKKLLQSLVTQIHTFKHVIITKIIERQTDFLTYPRSCYFKKVEDDKIIYLYRILNNGTQPLR